MARNEEKAQSMLYRFREAQAAELGLGTRSDRRPRMASACKSLRDCERWRGEILREISRKVSKIQDAGLTDYEVRDLNDDINRLMREKRHWENQIVALGGANYRRNVAMLDDDGKEVPGTKGYKYFGRAKELPGVKDLFQSRKNEEEEEEKSVSYYKKFMNQGPGYYGDLDEVDGTLLEYEQAAEESEWEDAYAKLRKLLGIPEDEETPRMPRPERTTVTLPPDDNSPALPSEKRKALPRGDDDDSEMTAPTEPKKRSKGENGTSHESVAAATPASEGSEKENIHLIHARAATAYIPFLEPDYLLPPKLPSRKDMEDVLLDLRKRVLVEEYFGTEAAQS